MHRTKRSNLASGLTMILATISLTTLSLTNVCLAQDGTMPPPGGPGQGGSGGPGGPGGPGGRGGQGGMRGDPAQMVERFMAMDADGDGKVSRDEATGPLAERIFGRADANGDGSVDRAELDQFVRSMPARGAEGARGREGAAGGEAGPGAGRGGLEGSMRQANGALRALRGSAFDAASQKSDLEAVQRLQGGLVVSKAAIASVPMSPAAKAKFGEDKAAYEKAFRKHLLESIVLAIEIEQALLDSDAAQAKAALARLEQAQQKGHDLFQDDSGESGEAGGERRRARGSRGPGGSDGSGGAGN